MLLYHHCIIVSIVTYRFSFFIDTNLFLVRKNDLSTIFYYSSTTFSTLPTLFFISTILAFTNNAPCFTDVFRDLSAILLLKLVSALSTICTHKIFFSEWIFTNYRYYILFTENICRFNTIELKGIHCLR